MSDLSLEVNRSDAEIVVVVTGEVDMATADQLDACLCDQTDRDVIVNLNGVPFLDSSGIGALVHARTVIRDAGHTLRVTGEQDNVRKVFEVTGLLDLLHGKE